MSKRFYAIKSGPAKGIYHSTWSEVWRYVDRYHEKARGFNSYDGVSQYMRETIIDDAQRSLSPYYSTDDRKMRPGELVAYLGSDYDFITRTYSWSIVIVRYGIIIKQSSGHGHHDDYKHGCSLSQSSEDARLLGELAAEMRVLQWSINHGYHNLVSYIHYKGVQQLATNMWKPRYKWSSGYQHFMQKYSKFVNCRFLSISNESSDEFQIKARQLASDELYSR